MDQLKLKRCKRYSIAVFKDAGEVEKSDSEWEAMTGGQRDLVSVVISALRLESERKINGFAFQFQMRLDKLLITGFMVFILIHQFLLFTCAAVPLTRNHNILLWGTSDRELDQNHAADIKDSKEGWVFRPARSPPPAPKHNHPSQFIVVPPGPEPARSPSSPPSSSPPPPNPCYHHRLGCIRPHNNNIDYYSKI
ncbi:OLC1v1026502C1 [Oldenlandia corymbosa var. corymbosa]|uniref:OLC1v1026502C1 n=1 Tax=Oldenlandia corymbosa var. corymbosa TaxID=529605 RepID=A0AAV1C8Z0_OLDCO|nr:OLC1v1026502C1 [Oldenlandia corymbosa var. corymbosa]